MDLPANKQPYGWHSTQWHASRSSQADRDYRLGISKWLRDEKHFTFDEIGIVFALTGTRARQLYLKATRIEARKKAYDVRMGGNNGLQ